MAPDSTTPLISAPRFGAQLGPLFSVAVRSLWLHRLRSFLTILGLVFGVASVIVMLAVAEGASEEAQKQIESLGARNIILKSNKPIDDVNADDEDSERVLEYGLTTEDLDRISNTIPTVVRTTPMREFPQEIRYQDRSLEGRVVGVTPDYDEMNSVTLAEGRFINDVDDSQYRNVCVIGHEVAEQLFPVASPMGRSIRVGPNHYYRIIGVTKHKSPSAGAGSSLSSEDFNKDVYIPFSTDRVRFGELLEYGSQGSFSWELLQMSQITVEVDDIQNVKATATVLEDTLAKFHPKQDYSVTVPLELLERAEKTKRIFSLVLGSTAAISLLVGGIGIMNIMLATVSERTHEIGIRRAIGARRIDIVSQFLVETAVLSLTGALVGMVLGLATPWIVSYASGMTTKITFWAPFIAVFVALSVGIIFGIYPARRAAYMDPIEALRSD